MKKRNKFLAGLTAVTVALSSFGMMCANAVSGKEMITNGSFESENTDTVGAAITELGNTTAISGMEYSTTVGYNDNSSIHITKAGTLTTPTKLGLTQGSKYNISFMIKGKLTTINGMYIRVGGYDYQSNAAKLKSDANGVFAIQVGTGEGIMNATAAENGWYKVESTTPWTCGTYMTEAFFNVTGGGEIDFYIDDLKITSASTSDTSGAIISQFGNNSAISGVEYTNVDAYEGEKSIHITKGNDYVTTPTRLGLIKGSTYNFSFMIKGMLTSSNGMYIRMAWDGTYKVNAAKIKSDENGAFKIEAGSSILKIEAAENGWYKVESTTPWTCSEMGIGFFNVQSSGGTVNFYIDNLSITDSQTNTEMITDGGFETAVIGTEIIENSSFGGHIITDTKGAAVTELGNTAAISGLEYSTKEAYDGKRALHISGISGNTDLAAPGSMGMEKGKSYNFSFYIKGKLASTNGMYIRLGWGANVGAAKLRSDNNGKIYVVENYGDAILNVTAAENDWYKIESKTPWKYTDDVKFMTATTGGGTVDFYIDKLSVTEELPDEEIGAFAMSGDTADKTVTISVTNNGHADGYSAILILATYKDDVMQSIAMNDAETVVEMGKTETLTQTITVKDGETLTAYLWDGLSGMTPLKECDDLITVTAAE